MDNGMNVNEQQTPTALKKQKARSTEMAVVAMAVAVVVFVAVLSFAVLSLVFGVKGMLTPSAMRTNPPAGTYSVVPIVGTIQNVGGDSLGVNEPSYKHGATVAYIKQLAQDEGNKGILLYMNTGGGGVYESDEVYRALMDYKEQTGRPVWAYMATTCASGGYYICMAADYITANYNTTTGSIGVYIALTDTSELYGNIGVETVLIRSGENKGVGTEGVPITEEQREVYQSIVDESYDRFVELIVQGRGMAASKVREVGDGRPYTASQALKLDLIDEVGDWETAQAAFAEHTGAGGYVPSFSQRTPLGRILGEVQDMLPRSDAEVVEEMAVVHQNGVPMMYAPGLVW